MATATERAYELKDKIHELAQAMAPEDAIAFPELFKTWSKGTTYVGGEKVTRRGEVYKCNRKHIAKAGWEPEKEEKWTKLVVEEPVEEPVEEEPVNE